MSSPEAMTPHRTPAALEISGLCVQLPQLNRRIVSEVSLRVEAGQIGALVGESGSGKSTVALAVFGYTKAGAQITGGSICAGGVRISRLTPAQLRRFRRSRVSYVPQDPGSALNPALRLGTQLRRAIRSATMSNAERQARVREALRAVSLPTTTEFLRRYPQEISGGQQQRVLIAMAVAKHPDVIVWDEPTTGLDVVTKEEILRLIASLCRTQQIAGLYISHDLAAVAKIADTIQVMQPESSGTPSIAEQGPSERVLRQPSHRYTRQLLEAVPSLQVPARHADTAAPIVLSATNLDASYGDTPVLHQLNLRLRAGQCLALVGESGSGKSTLSKALAGFANESGAANVRGEITFTGDHLPLNFRQRTAKQRSALQYVFQNPYSSFQPRRSIGESLRLAALSSGKNADTRTLTATLRRVGLQPSHADRYPDELSGGERQRAAIARALVCEPALILCDEITSALDVSIQAQIIELLQQLMTAGVSLLCVTHDLAVAKALADQVMVLQQGKAVEYGPAAEVFEQPQHPYTRQLLAHSSSIDAALRQRESLHP